MAIESGKKVGKIFERPAAKHSTAFASGLCRVSGHVRLLSSSCVNNGDNCEIGGKNEWEN